MRAFFCTVLVGKGLAGAGLVGKGLAGAGLVGEGLAGAGLVGKGLVGAGFITTGATGLGRGLNGDGAMAPTVKVVLSRYVKGLLVLIMVPPRLRV